MSDIPAYMRVLVRHVLHRADQLGDGHPGWAAICDNWDLADIARTLARARVREPHHAVLVMDRVANEIVANTAAMRAGRVH